MSQSPLPASRLNIGGYTQRVRAMMLSASLLLLLSGCSDSPDGAQPSSTANPGGDTAQQEQAAAESSPNTEVTPASPATPYGVTSLPPVVAPDEPSVDAVAPDVTGLDAPTAPEPVRKKTDLAVVPSDSKDPSGPNANAVEPEEPVASLTERDDVLDPKLPTNRAAELEAQLAAFEIPPDWIADVRPNWSTSKPWKEARQEIRRLLGKGDDKSRREGIRLTWDYLQKNDIGDRHEYGMYMFLGNEPLWAIKAYRARLERTDLNYPPFFGVRALASLYAEFGVFEEAEKVLQDGLKLRSPDPKWNEMRAAEMHDSFGDLYVAWGDTEKAKDSYMQAARLYPLGKPPYGRHLLPRRVKKVQSKLDLLSMQSLAGTSLRNGRYQERALGYSGDINLTVSIESGRIADIKVQHQEKIDQNACKLIPARIIDEQSLQVDGVTGATVTKDAIVAGTLRALKKAGLQ